jgi:hypothetical protein
MRSQEPTAGLRRLQPIQKAARLLAEGRVRLVADDQVYIVEGDSDTYYVSAGPRGIHCPCPATTMLCSHALAVMQVRQRDEALSAQLPVAELPNMETATAHLGEVA